MLVNWQIKMTFRRFIRIFLVTAQKQKQDCKFPKYYFLSIRGYSWHKSEIKLIRRGYYSSNNFQDSTKRKTNRNKNIMDCLPKSSFFIAIKMGMIIWWSSQTPFVLLLFSNYKWNWQRNKNQIKNLIKLNRIKPKIIKATIYNVYMWMGNIEFEGDNLMLVDQ